MENKTDVLMKILQLSESTLEGLEHVHRRAMEGHFEKTAGLFTDIVESFHRMETALQPYLPECKGTELEQKTADVVQGLKLMLAAYEGDRDVRPVEILQFSLLPRYRAWQEALRSALGPYTAS